MKRFSKQLGTYLRSGESLALPAIVVLVGLGAFGLGRLSVGHGDTEAGPVNGPKTSGTYLASKSGGKYYLPGCPGTATIKESNKVWFDTEVQAQAAGYTPAANCPGL